MSSEHPDILIDDALLARYGADECTPAERAAVARWAEARAGRRRTLDSLLVARDILREQLLIDHADLNQAWERVRLIVTAKPARLETRALSRDIQGESTHRQGVTSKLRSASLGARPLRVWAAMKVVAVCGIVVFAIAGLRHRLTTASRSITRTYATVTGQQATITLADGSRVRLAPESRLVIADGFGTAHRTVELLGEAFFTVTNISTVPFVVRTERISTRVLGTAFDVRRYPMDRAVQVVVASGKVAVRGPRAQVTLTSGTIGQVTDSTAIVSATDDPKGSIGWTDGRLVFDNVPVRAMLITLGRWYGYQFRIADSTFDHESVHAEFRAGAPVETLRRLQDVLDVTLTFDKTTVTLHPRRGDALSSSPREGRELLSHSTEMGK